MRGRALHILIWSLCGAALLGAGGRALAVPPDLLRITPPEPIAAVWADFSSTGAAQTAGAASIETVARLAQSFRGATRLRSPDTVGIVLDSIFGLAAVREYPFAVFVADAAARALPDGGHRLANLQLAVVLHTSGRNQPVAAEIQSLLDARTDPTHSQISRRDAFGTTVFTLTDSRLPEWVLFHWAAVGDYYVLALGNEVFDQVMQTVHGDAEGLARDSWIATQHRRIGDESAMIEWMIDFQRLRGRLAPAMGERATFVIDALGFGEIDRAMWSVSRRGRAIIVSAVYRKEKSAGETPAPQGEVVVPISTGVTQESALASVIPSEAETYAVIDYSPRRLIERIRGAVEASGSGSAPVDMDRCWQAFEARNAVSTEADLMSQFGDHIILHNYPPHPLRIPLLCTVMFEIKGDSARVRRVLDALLTETADWLAPAASANNTIGSALQVRMVHEPDGIWYVQLGLLQGPAVIVTENWIVLSFSPQAVREYLARARMAGAPTTRPATSPAAAPGSQP